jgi:hypothetical protein
MVIKGVSKKASTTDSWEINAVMRKAPIVLTVAFTSAKMAEMCGNRQSDLPSIATSPKQQGSSENTNIHTLTQ